MAMCGIRFWGKILVGLLSWGKAKLNFFFFGVEQGDTGGVGGSAGGGEGEKVLSCKVFSHFPVQER